MDEKQGTTISVMEMGTMLGLKKTDAYWLVHKQCFETVTVGGKMRIVLKSFEHWYANQVKHRKIDGTPPGQELRANSYSIKEMADAKKRKAEIEYRQELGTLVIHKCQTIDELLNEYVALYGKATWSISMYTSNIALMKHYISPIIGSMKLNEVTPRVLERYYLQLLKTPAVHKAT